MMTAEHMPNANRLAALMHPARQAMVICDVIPAGDTMITYVLRAADGHELAWFQAGSYIPVFVEIDGCLVERPYALCSSPRQSAEGIYAITVKAADGGYVSNYIHKHWKKGTRVTLGAPAVAGTYHPLRDGKHVIAIAGGSGVVPFLSMAQAMIDGDLDCELTLFYGVNTAGEIIFREKWPELEKASGGRFRFVPVVADGAAAGCEKGFITLELIRKYCRIENASFFISGPPAMVTAVRAFLAPLGIERKYIRVSMGGDASFRSETECTDEYMLTVHMAGEVYTVRAKSGETILAALEQSGIHPAARCRSGRCGFCRAMVVKGEFRLADVEDGVRKADKRLGFLHPCCSYPASDMEIIVHRPG